MNEREYLEKMFTLMGEELPYFLDEYQTSAEDVDFCLGHKSDAEDEEACKPENCKFSLSCEKFKNIILTSGNTDLVDIACERLIEIGVRQYPYSVDQTTGETTGFKKEVLITEACKIMDKFKEINPKAKKPEPTKEVEMPEFDLEIEDDDNNFETDFTEIANEDEDKDKEVLTVEDALPEEEVLDVTIETNNVPEEPQEIEEEVKEEITLPLEGETEEKVHNVSDEAITTELATLVSEKLIELFKNKSIGFRLVLEDHRESAPIVQKEETKEPVKEETKEPEMEDLSAHVEKPKQKRTRKKAKDFVSKISPEALKKVLSDFTKKKKGKFDIKTVMRHLTKVGMACCTKPEVALALSAINSIIYDEEKQVYLKKAE